MVALSARGWALFAFWAMLVSFCRGDVTTKETSVVVVGSGECVDCMQQNIKTADAFSGLLVGVYCKDAKGLFKNRGSGELDKDGKFNVKIPNELVNKQGNLKEECFAQMHSASHDPCPATNGLEQSRIVFKSEVNGEHTFSTAGKLSFRPEICTSAFLWPHFKPHLKPLLPPKKPHFPLSKPKFKFPIPNVDPIYKPKQPLPIKPFLPIYKKPLPPVTIIPPIHKKPLPLVPKIPPIYKEPLPHVPKILPIHKKPLPTIPKIPPVFEKPVPKIPPFKKPLPSHPKFAPIFKKPWPPIIFKKPLPHLGGGHPFTP